MSIQKRVGRRGAFLAFLAVLDVCYGYGQLVIPAAMLGKEPDFFLPWHIWGWIWIGAGLVCASGIPVRRDVPQFVVAALIKAIWGALYAAAWIVQGYPRSWISVAVWFSFAFTVLLISGWPESGHIRGKSR